MSIHPIQITTADHIAEDAHNADFIVVNFSRSEVEAGSLDDALSRLEVLSDSMDFVVKFKDQVSFCFDGYDADFRELYEIPECRNFMRQLNARWPYWFHFLEKGGHSFAVLFRLLCETEVMRRLNGQIGFRFKEPKQPQQVALSLFVGINALYAAHGVERESNARASTESVIDAYNKAMGQ